MNDSFQLNSSVESNYTENIMKVEIKRIEMKICQSINYIIKTICFVSFSNLNLINFHKIQYIISLNVQFSNFLFHHF